MRGKFSSVRALVFDVFGTVVDWRGSIVREAKALARAKKLDLDPAQFADAWRAGYQPAMARVRSGELGWTKIDALHRLILDDLLARFGVRGLKEAEIEHLNRVWHRLSPWPDARAGLKALKKSRIIGTLSNGNVSLLANMAKFGLTDARFFSTERHGCKCLNSLKIPENVLKVAHNAHFIQRALC